METPVSSADDANHGPTALKSRLASMRSLQQNPEQPLLHEFGKNTITRSAGVQQGLMLIFAPQSFIVSIRRRGIVNLGSRQN